MKRKLLMVSAAIEIATGLALLVAPMAIVAVLLGGTLDSPGALAVGRVAGAALLSLGVACGLVGRDAQSRASNGIITAMLLYNAAAVAILVHARFREGLAGMGLWPAAVLHAGLAAWCVTCLLTVKPSRAGEAQP